MPIKTSKDLLKEIRNLDNTQLNKSYRKWYKDRLKDDIRMSKQRNKVGIRGYTKAHIRQLERELKNIDKNFPFIEKITVEIE